MDAYAYVDIARDGESNMAIDRQLLEMAERERCIIVRLYRWSQPTLSLGHFQATADRNAHPPSALLPSVVRASGGGAIVHDNEWTYSIAAPVHANRVGAATHLYDLVHDALVAGLRQLGWDARKVSVECTSATPAQSSELGCSTSNSSVNKSAFLCFQRRSCGDIVVGNSKVVGSAQRRLGSSVLQHGSLLCSASEFAPELPGLAELVTAGNVLTPAANRPPHRFLKKHELNSENFGYDMLSWVVAPLLESMDLTGFKNEPPLGLIEAKGMGQ